MSSFENIHLNQGEAGGGPEKGPEKGKESLDVNQLQKDLEDVSKLEKIERQDIEPHLDKVLEILQNEPENIRPKDKNGQPGGLIELKKDIPTILIPDLHGRKDFLLKILNDEDEKGITNLEKLLKGEIQIVSLGDALHTEDDSGKRRDDLRWEKASQEQVKSGKSVTPTMEEEIADSFGAIIMIMKLKELSPENFHYLRGNHDDTNETYTSFRKFAAESTMVKNFIKEKYGEDFLKKYAEFEENLPLLAHGNKFFCSHAFPNPLDPGKDIKTTIERALNYKDERGNKNNDSAFRLFCWTRFRPLIGGDEAINTNVYLQTQGITYFYGHDYYDPLVNVTSRKSLVAANALGGYLKVDPNGNYEQKKETEEQKPAPKEQSAQQPENEEKKKEPTEPEKQPEKPPEKTLEKPPEKEKIQSKEQELLEKQLTEIMKGNITPDSFIKFMTTPKAGEFVAEIMKDPNFQEELKKPENQDKIKILIEKFISKEKEKPKPEAVKQAKEVIKKEEEKGKKSFWEQIGGGKTFGVGVLSILAMILILILLGEFKLVEKAAGIGGGGGEKKEKKK